MPFRKRYRPRRPIAAAAAAALLLTACAAPVSRTTRVIEAAPGKVPVASAAAARYGTVLSIDEIDTRVHDSGGAAALGAVIGGVVGNTIGRGSGRAAATALGIFGGAVAGDGLERRDAAAGSGVIYRVHVRFDDGSTRSFDCCGLDGLHSGERVRLQHGRLERA